MLLKIKNFSFQKNYTKHEQNFLDKIVHPKKKKRLKKNFSQQNHMSQVGF